MAAEEALSAYREYHSSVDATLRLYARFAPLAEAAPLMLQMHGWHGQVKSAHSDNVTPPADEAYFRVAVEMRGRGDSDGWPDANGWELQDAVDGLDAARSLYPQAVADAVPHLHGGSGGGGNVLGILGKFPDLFAAAVCECGIADYSLWYANDTVGEFRDGLRDAGWVGGGPGSNAEAYLSRGGRTTAMNLLTPLLIIHGEEDPRVPYEQATAYAEALRRHGRESLLRLQGFPGVGNPGHYSGMSADDEALRETLIAAHHGGHSARPTLPERGRFVVTGYLRTQRFAIRLEKVDHVALLDYDLGTGQFNLVAPSSRHAICHFAGETRLLSARPIDLAAFCREIAVPHPAELPIRPIPPR